MNILREIITKFNLLQLNFFTDDGSDVGLHSLDKIGFGVEGELKYQGIDEPLSSAFRVVNNTGSNVVSGIKDKKIKTFVFGTIYIHENYRNIGICSYMLLSVIVFLLKKHSNQDVLVYLVNTSNTIVDKNKSIQYDLYNSILTCVDEKNERLQYRLFSKNSRKYDLKIMNILLKGKKRKILSKIKEKSK